MIFPEKKSALVRLSDSVKLGIEDCCSSAAQIISYHERYARELATLRRSAEEAFAEPADDEQTQSRLSELASTIPVEVSMTVVPLQGQLHSRALSAILNCSFCLESYINALAYFLLEESASIGLNRQDHETTLDVADETKRMPTVDKWEKVGKLRNKERFDKSRSPFQYLKILFDFRNDIAHDKMIHYEAGRTAKRYGGKLPDPVFGLCDLSHVLFAAETYWNMVHEVHRLIGVSEEAFQRHYNLSPWFSEEQKQHVQNLSLEYRTKTGVV